MSSSLKSRILQFLPEDLLRELNKICRDVTISNNNKKADMMFEALTKYDVDFTELGLGTNRAAVLIDGYVFKLAMDRLGVQDNWAEFSLTQELQPYVIKVYECNGLVIVTEYVTVISRDEFSNNKETIRRILGTISDRYLIGDVGTVERNFMNWGYRDNDELTILDFGYIYRLQGEEMECKGINDDGTVCSGFLEYDENFYRLRCPVCGKKYQFTDIRLKIDPEFEKREVEMVKQIAEVVTEPLTENLSDEYYNEEPYELTVDVAYNIYEGENEDMERYRNNKISNEELENSYASALEFLKNTDMSNQTQEIEEDEEITITSMNKVEETAIDFTEELDQTSEDTEALDDENVYEKTIDYYMGLGYEISKTYDPVANTYEAKYPQFPDLGTYVARSDDAAEELVEAELRSYFIKLLANGEEIPTPAITLNSDTTYNDIYAEDTIVDIGGLVDKVLEDNDGVMPEIDDECMSEIEAIVDHVNTLECEDDPLKIYDLEAESVIDDNITLDADTEEPVAEEIIDDSDIVVNTTLIEEYIMNNGVSTGTNQDCLESNDVNIEEPVTEEIVTEPEMVVNTTPVDTELEFVTSTNEYTIETEESIITIEENNEVETITIEDKTEESNDEPQLVELTVSDSVEQQDEVIIKYPTQSENPTSFIEVIPPDDDGDDLRKELRSDLIADGTFTDEDLDEFDKMYDDAVSELQDKKYNKKQ